MGTVLVGLAVKSVLNRRLTAGLTVLSVAVSVALLVGVDRIRTEARDGFANTISGADLIVGARGGPLNLLLYSVFRIGDATSGISWDSYEAIAERPEVAWTIPLSLGDSHRGYRVLGTTDAYLEHYRHGRDQRLELLAGTGLSGIRDAVLGAEVADRLGYAVGDSIVVSHGIGDISFEHHDEMPFTVTGILAPTGTPVDRTVHVTLAGIEAIHDDSAHAGDNGGHADEHGDHADHQSDDHADDHGDHGDEHAGEHGDHGDGHEDDHGGEHGRPRRRPWRRPRGRTRRRRRGRTGTSTRATTATTTTSTGTNTRTNMATTTTTMETNTRATTSTTTPANMATMRTTTKTTTLANMATMRSRTASRRSSWAWIPDPCCSVCSAT